MADPEQLRILLQGVEAWNAWRRFPWSCPRPASRSARRRRLQAAEGPDGTPTAWRMTTRPIPARHWRSYGDEPLPTGAEALDEPFRAFPSWFMRITCDRCGKDRMISRDARGSGRHADPRHPQAHAPRRLRRTTGTRRVAHRHRGRQQPAGAQDRAARVTRRPRRIYGGDYPHRAPHCATAISACWCSATPAATRPTLICRRSWGAATYR